MKTSRNGKVERYQACETRHSFPKNRLERGKARMTQLTPGVHERRHGHGRPKGPFHTRGSPKVGPDEKGGATGAVRAGPG